MRTRTFGPAWKCFSNLQSNKEEFMSDANGAPRKGTLNIISHGTKAIVLDGALRYVIPDVENYSIVAGTFLEEQPLERGKVYKLEGVKSGDGPQARVATGSNIFLVGVSLQRNAAIFCELDLPIPATFRSVRGIDIEADWFPGSKAFLQFSSQIALVHVLSYDFEDAAKLQILDEHGQPFAWKPKFDATTKTVNLHIYSDPLTDGPPKVPAFTSLTKLFGQEVALDLSAVGPFVPPPTIYPEIHGLESPLEIQEFTNGRPQSAAKQPPYSCATVVAVPPGHSASRALASTGSLGFSVSVKGD
jgi:hypothetical protein